jgi:peptidoglycan/xylan/chitin deacetylase (PgdA/CDA1 family)
MQPVAWSIRQVMEAIMPGSVIVLHDGHGHGRKVAGILEAVIPQIRARGYEFVTVEEMQIKRNPLAAESEARHYNPSKA